MGLQGWLSSIVLMLVSQKRNPLMYRISCHPAHSSSYLLVLLSDNSSSVISCSLQCRWSLETRSWLVDIEDGSCLLWGSCREKLGEQLLRTALLKGDQAVVECSYTQLSEIPKLKIGDVYLVAGHIHTAQIHYAVCNPSYSGPVCLSICTAE